MHRALVVTLSSLLVAAACGGGAEENDDLADVEESETEEVTEPTDDVIGEDEPDVEPEQEPDGGSGDEYLDALVEQFEGGPEEMIDVDCLATGIVDAVGVDEFEAAAVEPEDLAASSFDDLESIGIGVTPGLREAVRSVFRECFDGAVLAREMLGSFEFGFPDEVMDCIADSTGSLMSEGVADLFVDGSGEFGLGQLGDAAEIGAECTRDLALEKPGASVRWAEGEGAFVDGFVAWLATPDAGGASGVTEAEASCFAEGIADILGPALAEVPSLTVGELGLYLSGGTTPDAIGFRIDDAAALALAESNVACIDSYRVTAEATAHVMTALVDADDELALRLESCYRELLNDGIWIENLRLQYLHGSNVFGVPEAEATLALLFEAGEFCGAEALSASN